MLSMMVRQHVIIAKLVISMPTYRIIVITMMIVNDADAGADYHRPNQHNITIAINAIITNHSHGSLIGY